MASPSVNIAVNSELSGVNSQWKAAQATVRSATDEMVSAGQRAQAAWQQAAQAALANANAQKELKVAMDAARGSSESTAAAVTQLAQAKRNATTAAQQLAIAEKAATAAMQAETAAAIGATGAENRHAVSMHEAKGAAALLGEETGVRLNRHLRGVLASSELLGPILEAAFPIAAAIGFFDVIKEGAEKLSEMISDWVIYTEEMKKAYAAQIECNKQVANAIDETRRLQAEHFANTHSASEVAQRDLTQEIAHQQQLREQIQARQKDIADLHTAQSAWQARGGTPGYTGAGAGQNAQANEAKEGGWNREIAEANAELGKSGAQIEVLKDKLKEANEPASTLKKTVQDTSRALEEAQKLAHLKLELSNNGLQGMANSLDSVKPDSMNIAEENARRALEAVKHNHEEVTKLIDEEAKHRAEKAEEFYQKQKEEMEAAAKAAQEMREEKDLGAQNTREQGLGKIDVQETAVKGQAATGQITPQQELEALRSLDEQKLAIERAYIAAKMQIDAGDEKAYAKELNDLQATRDKSLANVSQQQTQVKGQAASGQIGHQDELEELRNLDEQKLEIERAYVTAKQAIDAGDTKAVLKDQNEEVKLEQKAAQQKLQGQYTQLQLSEQAYKQWAQQVSGTMFSGVNSWMQHQKTFGQGMKQEWNSIAMDTIKVFEQMGEKWVMTHVLMRAASMLFHTTDVAQASSAALAKMGLDSATMLAAGEAQASALVVTGMMNSMAASSYAAVAAAAALASTAAIPIVGPALAPAAAATMLATGEAFAAMAAFDIGGVVPKTQVAMVHGGERVLTGRQNSFFEQMVNQSTTNNAGRGGDVHVHNNMSALDGTSTRRVMRRNSKDMVKEVTRAMRLGKIG